MSLRHIALYLVVAGLSIYAWKDWFKSLCGLIIMMGIMQCETMPKAVLGIQGLNPWNVLFTVIFLAWGVHRSREGLWWDMPQNIRVLLFLYAGVIIIGFLRAVFDRSHIEDYPLRNLISEELINTIKWIIPGVLLFDGCRTRHRVIMIHVCVLVALLLLAAQVMKHVPSDSLVSHRVLEQSRRDVGETGYNADNMSAMLAGAFWGALAAVPLARRVQYKAMVLAMAGVFAVGQAMTGGRAGYIAWVGTGLVLCVLKWQRQLLLVPVVLLLLPRVFPAAVDRMFVGFGQTDVSGAATADRYEVTSGRNLIWPVVIDHIGESPVFGHGRLAMRRIGVTDYLGAYVGQGEAVGHPHNMYLETLLDNGVLGSLPIFLFWGTIVLYSARLFRSGNRLYSATGGLTLSLVLTQLFAGMGSQHFYPKEETFAVWMTMFLTIRVCVEERGAAEYVGGSESLNWSY